MIQAVTEDGDEALRAELTKLDRTTELSSPQCSLRTHPDLTST